MESRVDSNSWIGKRMRNPKGEIGIVINDSNGIYRVLTVRFEDNHTEQLWLSNTSKNPKESWEWCWEFEREGKKEWVRWGEI